ncbi:hypothetical protein SAMN05216464_10582 [Mucilaginibacter pineti]|uniref:Uncharacterized protein n=1 Tax=Mucilaginibacter pineti TaxID=1391627 RepID=A0A1G7BM22_9SPHI|nr:hypothetical protein [Mucilaginibacter pineti]SDE28089.1 hypothetical protein SAMN05216464_10582 [Mucilaginibacter pineti]
MEKMLKLTKDNLLSILVSLCIVTFLLNVFFSVSLEVCHFIGTLLAIAAFSERRGSWSVKQYKLKNKGLTQQDIRNIEFVKKWEETRKKGIWKYCISDGGIVLGAGLSLAISLLAYVTFPGIFKGLADSPGNMFSFIGYAYLAGAITGATIHRILWPYNQRRFMKLTDPLNDKYLQELFLDQ